MGDETRIPPGPGAGQSEQKKTNLKSVWVLRHKKGEESVRVEASTFGGTNPLGQGCFVVGGFPRSTTKVRESWVV